MATKFWVKLYIEILDDPKMGRLPNHLWRRLVELILLAGRQGDDGALPPVEEMAWSLRLSADRALEDLHSLAETGVVHEAEPGRWVVTHFKERQRSESLERVRRYRERHGNGPGNAGAAGGDSPSPSDSLEEGVQGEEPVDAPRPAPRVMGQAGLPQSPAEAMLHPDVRVFTAATGGRIPGLSQYRAVVETVRLLRLREKLEDPALEEWLKPYWLAWSGRRRLDGRPYDPGNITWLTEWALNGSIPPAGGAKAAEAGRRAVKSPEETRRMLAEKEKELKNAVPPPESVRAKIKGLAGQLGGKEAA